MCWILSVVATVRLGVMATGKLGVADAAKPTVVATEEKEEEVGSFGHPCWSKMSTHSWLPALRARTRAVCP